MEGGRVSVMFASLVFTVVTFFAYQRAGGLSMRHCVGNDVDPQGVGFLDRELLEVPAVFSFPFPTIP